MSRPKKTDDPFRWFDSSPEVIRLVVLMYVRYPLSLRNVEDLLFERGIDICHETVRLWWNRFGPIFAGEIRRKRGETAQWRGQTLSIGSVRRLYPQPIPLIVSAYGPKTMEMAGAVAAGVGIDYLYLAAATNNHEQMLPRMAAEVVPELLIDRGED